MPTRWNMSIGTTIRAIFVTRVCPDQGFWQNKDRSKHEELIGGSFSSLRLLQLDRPHKTATFRNLISSLELRASAIPDPSTSGSTGTTTLVPKTVQTDSDPGPKAVVASHDWKQPPNDNAAVAAR
jgi:hypothetical protein